MRIALVTPYYRLAARGNAVTVRRIETQLQRLGCEVAVFSLEDDAADTLTGKIGDFAPDIVHAFHAVRCGSLANTAARQRRIPYIVTFTGTDLFPVDTDGPGAADDDVLSGAAALVFFAEAVRHGFVATRSTPGPPTVVIPQGVTVPPVPAAEPPATAEFTFFLPAGIRAVKNLLFPFAPLAELHRRHDRLRLLLAGGVIEPDYAAQVLAAVTAAPFARWLGEVSFERMPALYGAAHVVLNSSLSEGGMANSLIEAMAWGRPVLAAAIEGNRSFIRDGENGLLYRTADEFTLKATALLQDEKLRQQLGAAGRQYVAANCSPEREAERYLELYRSSI